MTSRGPDDAPVRGEGPVHQLQDGEDGGEGADVLVPRDARHRHQRVERDGRVGVGVVLGEAEPAPRHRVTM